MTCEAELTPNCIVNVEQTGANDYWGILHKFSLNEILMARIYDLETMLRKIMEKEKETGTSSLNNIRKIFLRSPTFNYVYNGFEWITL